MQREEGQKMKDIKDREDFDKVNEWVLEIEKKIYKKDENMLEKIEVKMKRYVEEIMKLKRDEERKVKKKFYIEYGKKMKGMME